MSRFVDRAEAAGVVRREADPPTGAPQVTLTDAGVELLRKMRPVYERGIEVYLNAHAGAGDRLRRVLERVADSAR